MLTLAATVLLTLSAYSLCGDTHETPEWRVMLGVAVMLLSIGVVLVGAAKWGEVLVRSLAFTTDDLWRWL